MPHSLTPTLPRRLPIAAAALLCVAAQAATVEVTSEADSGAGSLRAALAAAQPGDIITFASTVRTVQLSGALAGNNPLTVSKKLTLSGPGVTLDGGYNTSVLVVSGFADVRIEGLTITRGALAGAGGTNGGNALGAGISNYGRLTLIDVTVSANAAAGGGADGGDGGGGGAFAGTNTLYVAALGGSQGANPGGDGGLDGTDGADPYVNDGSGKGGTQTGPGAGGATGGYGGGGGAGLGGGGGGGSGDGGSGGQAGNGAVGALFAGGGGGQQALGGVAASGGGGGGGTTSPAPGGNAAAGLYNAGTLILLGGNRIAGNVAAGGGGNGYDQRDPDPSANGGSAVGGVWNASRLFYGPGGAPTAVAGNAAGSGGAGGGGAAAPSVANLYTPASGQTGYLLTVTVTGGGSVSAGAAPAAADGGIQQCDSSGGAACQAGYASPAGAAPRVTLTATPPAGQAFTAWGGACSGTAPTCTVTMDQARSVTAAFGAAPVAVPTLGQWGLMLLGLLAAGLGGRGLRRHQRGA